MENLSVSAVSATGKTNAARIGITLANVVQECCKYPREIVVTV